MKEKSEGIVIIASSNYRLCVEEKAMVKGGSHEPFIQDSYLPVSGCGCCMCSPSRSASGAASYTATASGGR